MTRRAEARQVANGHWRRVLEASGLDGNVLDGNHHPCPLCGGTDRFRFDDKEGRGTYYCNGCGAGDGFKLLMGHMGAPFKDAAEFIRRFLGNEPVQALPAKAEPASAPSVEEQNERKLQDLRRTWDKARPVLKGDAAWRYLTVERELPLEKMPTSLRFHPRLAYAVRVKEPDGTLKTKVVGYFPGLLAKVVDPSGKAVSIHRTYLSPEGCKAPVEQPKKLMAGLPVHGGAIRLMPHGDVLGVAEGIETAFAAHALTGIPTWATISATIMQGFEVPPGVRAVVIFADNDAPDNKGRRAGQEASEVLKARLEAQGIKVKVMIPCKAGSDFHDVWIGRLAKQKAQHRA